LQELEELSRFDDLLWAKSNPIKPLLAHMVDVGVCMRSYLDAPYTSGVLSLLAELLGCSKEAATDISSYVASLHDIGKAVSHFQKKDELLWAAWKSRFSNLTSFLWEDFRHEVYGEQILRKMWEDNGFFKDDRLCGMFATVIRLHHQGKPVVIRRDNNAFWLGIQINLEAVLRDVFKPRFDFVQCRNLSAAGLLLSGLVILCDWVASSKAYDNLIYSGNLKDYIIYSVETAQRTLRSYGLVSDTRFPIASRFCDMWPEIPKDGLRPIQRACETLPLAPLTIIEAPMGEGKTEAALYLAGRLCQKYGKSGIYMALPTAATSNQMFGRVEKMLGRLDVAGLRLLHGMAWVVEDEMIQGSDFSMLEAQTASEAADWLRPLRKGMLAGSAVGTVDQAMKSALCIKYGALRFVGLSNKVLIVDEIHAYDTYMSVIIARLLSWCNALSIPVILLSATMQDAQKMKYLGCYGGNDAAKLDSAYPLLTSVFQDGTVEQYPVEEVHMHREYRFLLHEFTDDAAVLADFAVRKVANGGNLCMMLNTVKRAQEVYEQVKERADGETLILLFHARFTASRRAAIERECLSLFGKGDGCKRPVKAILVCTQVVEQSLDIDFDGMISEIAPVDLLLQRAGRVHRHPRSRPSSMATPLIDVIIPPRDEAKEPKARFGVNALIYQAYILKKTEDFLLRQVVIRMPEDIRHCINAVYAGENGHLEYLNAYVMMNTKNEMQTADAAAVTLPVPVQDVFFADNCLHWRMSLSDADQGDFASLSYAATRQGQDSIRVALLDESLYQRALSQELGSADIKAIYLQSVSISAKKVADAENRIKSGILKGLVLLANSDSNQYKAGEYAFSYDDEYGVRDSC